MPSFTLSPLSRAPAAGVEPLLDAAFGADRHLRTAYRLRTRSRPIDSLSLAAWSGDALTGVLQCWPIALQGDAGGTAVPLVLVGPVAVLPDRQSAGLGMAMMRHMLAAADADADPHGDVLAMVGDPGYYGRFGFDAADTGDWRLPGPWEPHRLLARRRGGRPVPARGLLVER